MPQKQKEQTKITLARDGRSRETDAEAKDLQEEYEEEFRAITAKATAASERFHAPPTRSGSGQYPSVDQWPKAAKELIRKFVRKLCVIRPDFSWVRQKAVQAFPIFGRQCEGWITVISELESYRAKKADYFSPLKLGETMEGLRSEYRGRIARAMRLALSEAKRRLAKVENDAGREQRSGRPDIFQRIMKKHPELCER